jgi:lycopene beta-cyclase
VALDLILVGGGLANGLLAWRLAMTRPEVSFVLLERGASLGGEHTWTFHGTDVTKAQLEWLWVLATKSWHAHDVAFGREVRRLGGGHHALTGEDLHWKLSERLGERVRLRTEVVELAATHVVLAGGERLEARAVIDGRGPPPAPAGPCGWQHTFTRDVELEAPHALDAPLFVDARFEEPRGVRWVSLFPWDARRLVVRDTLLTTQREPELSQHRARLDTYLEAQKLRVTAVRREVSAVLPLPLGGAAPVLDAPRIGVAAGLFHASTGASLPMAVDVAEALPALTELSAPSLTAWLAAHARRHWAQQAFFRAFNRVLFTSPPERQLPLLEALHRHDEASLARFHAGTVDLFDRLAIMRDSLRVAPALSALRAWL